ncbi:MAG: phage tail fiber protein [archaeon]
MEGNLSNYLEEKVLNKILRNEDFIIENVYVGLVSDSATDAELESGDLTNEITGYDGDRKQIICSPAEQYDGKGRSLNTEQIDFDNMAAVTIKYAILCDSPIPGEGNILIWAPAESIKTSNEGDTYRIPTENFAVLLD